MTATKRVNPYERLRLKVSEFAQKVYRPKTKTMWTYEKKHLDEGWPLGGLAQRVRAADQLGWDVRLRWDSTSERLVVEYVERLTADALELL